MSNNFRVGQRVRCVNAHHIVAGADPLIMGGIYEIEGIGMTDSFGMTLFVKGATARNQAMGYGYRAYRFRPLQASKKSISDDIALFKGLLNTKEMAE